MNSTFCRLGCARPYIKILVVILLATAYSACDKEGFSYDVSDQQSSYIVADTVTMNMQTLLLDSVPTSGTGILLCGRQQDPYFGSITAGTFFKLQLPSGGNPTLEESATFDSVELQLKTNRTIYGDTTRMQDIQVYEVLQTIESGDDDYYLYSHNDFQTASQPLGSLQQVVRPSEDTILRIKLPASYGAPLFQLFKNKANEVSTQTIFLEYYKGLALKPGSNAGNIISLLAGDTSVILRLHYHINEAITEERHIDLNLYDQSLQFNQVSTDRTGTPLAALSASNNALSSTQTGNMTFIQPLSGIVTRIDMPYIKGLASVGKFFKVMRATLTVEPIAGTYNDYYTLPPAMTLCEVDKQNKVTDTLIDSYGSYQYGNLIVDNVLHENTRYTYDITQYCINEINSTDVNSRGLLLIPTRGAYMSSFNRAVIGDSKNRQNKISIQVYYLLYN
ncbi:DUF4270 family protein [Chitinophaga japonensis]|uniref:Uncharacterized protein DUF4270 n=1 Tax=Chitinophaga japonensis TaxID=104662 RepID=A0A562T467_CHIJA|nr:DUF4270 family protein [Chitinophaga japonensis]TWI88335.1 uncharacterized protein DUF4270 [Chitinophaga japonensis]